jgi:hypothetical protein
MSTSKSNTVINVNEGQVTFKRFDGHKHDGLTSTLIDTSRYSMFDFIATENSNDTRRRSTQQNNKNVLKTFIIDTIEGRVLNPEGIRIQANAVTAREIVAGTITANELSSNIVLVNNVIRSANYVNNSTQKTGWAILSNGSADFLNVNIRGNIASGDGVYANVNTPFYADINGLFSLKNKLTWDGNNLTINGSVSLINTNIGTFDNGDSLTDGFIGGININGSEIQSNGFSSGSSGFRISSNGNAEFNNVIVRGTVEAGAGLIGGWDISGSDLIGGAVVSDGFNGSYTKLDAEGYIIAYRQDPDIGFGTFWTKIDLNKANPGITVTGTANSAFNQTRILSSFISTSIVEAGQLRASSSLGVGTDTNQSLSSIVDASGVFASQQGFLTIARNGNCLVLNGTASGTASQQVAEFRRRGSQPGSSGIYVSNTAVAYSTTSDYRLKINVQQIPESLKILDRLNPIKFDWVSSEEKNIYGFLAHELQEILPYAVMGEKDAKDEDGYDKYQSIDASFVVPLLTAALKESVVRIDELEARIQTLEGV